MDLTATLATDAPPGALFAAVEDLGRYPDWLDIVPRAEPAEPAEGDPGPAWSVDLRGQVGPFRRSKRLRMVRTVHRPHTQVRFERREVAGRPHSPWVLDAGVERSAGGAVLTMRLHYGGGLWVPLLDRVLADEVERSRPRLAALVAAGPGGDGGAAS